MGFATAAVSTQPTVPPPLPPLPPVPQPVEAAPSPPPAPEKPPVQNALHEEEADTPLGDWQTESKGVVRIAQCGAALCGYTLNPSSNDKGEAILINMKPKTDARWTGNVYSKDSGATYYGTVAMKGPNTLRVEACAFGRFYCSGNNWIRISARPMITQQANRVAAAVVTFMKTPGDRSIARAISPSLMPSRQDKRLSACIRQPTWAHHVP